MAKLQTFICFAIFITLVFSTPIKQKTKRSFKVKRVEVPNYVPNGPKAYKRALFKFGFDDISFVPGGEVASRIKAATAASINSTGPEDGETPAAPTQNDAQFLSPVNVGGQTLIMNFDSGSSDTYVLLDAWHGITNCYAGGFSTLVSPHSHRLDTPFTTLPSQAPFSNCKVQRLTSRTAIARLH